MGPVNINKLPWLNQLSSECRVKNKSEVSHWGLSLDASLHIWGRLRLDMCSEFSLQEKALFISEPHQPNSSCHWEAPLPSWPQPHFTQPFPGLIWAHGKSVQRNKLQTTLCFTFSVLLLPGLAGYAGEGAGTRCRDKVTRKAGTAQLSAGATHKLSWTVSLSYTLPHVMALAQSY